MSFIDPLSKVFNELKKAEGRFILYKNSACEADARIQYDAAQEHVLEAIKAATELDDISVKQSLGLLFHALTNKKSNIETLLWNALNSVSEAICAEIGM